MDHSDDPEDAQALEAQEHIQDSQIAAEAKTHEEHAIRAEAWAILYDQIIICAYTFDYLRESKTAIPFDEIDVPFES